MKAESVVATGPGVVEMKSLVIDEPGDWDIAVELECAGLSIGTESYHISLADMNPRIIGYAPVARVTRVGVNAAGLFSVGDRVTYFAPNPPPASAGLGQLCGGYQSPAVLTVGPGRDLIAPNGYVVKVPPALQSEAAAFSGISAVSHMGAEMSDSKAGQKVLILGQGIIGLYATQHFALRGAEICVADQYAIRLKAAEACGADHCINTRAGDLVSAVKAFWPLGADIVVDSTASHRVVEQSLPALRQGGRYVFLGFYKGADFNLGALHGRVYDACFPWTLQGRLAAASLKLMARGDLRAVELISHRFPAGDAARAYETAAKHPDQTVGIMLDWRK